MEKRNGLTSILALAGVMVSALPLLLPVMFTLMRVLSGGSFVFDYLMPAELFPLVLAGGALLLWAAWRAHRYRRWITRSVLLAILLLLGSQLLAVLTGLADGSAANPDPWFALIVAVLVAYILSIVALVVGGLRLLREISQPANA